MAPYDSIYYPVDDGLTLYARDYNRSQSGVAILCLHGLSRNSADFEPLVEQLAGDYRVLVADQRGRGQSQWDSVPTRYQLPTYVRDMWQLLDYVGIQEVVVVGTSMGGLMGMLMAHERRERVAGLVINDVGPEVDPRGLARIMSYVGKSKSIVSWADAITQTKTINAVCFPEFNDQQWEQMARRLYRESSEGVPVAAYDPSISAPIANDARAAVPSDLWPLFESIDEVPLLAIRGARSDLLSPECFVKMQALQPTMQAVEIPNVGHAPVLDEVDAVVAIKQFIKACAC